MSGILKNDRPEFLELDEILKKGPSHTGIWIEESSRDKFLELLKNIAKGAYKINEDGFLIQEEKPFMNNYDKKIKQMISDNILNVFAVSSVCYIVDEVTGEIVEYPFEEMDPHQGFQDFQSDNKKIFLISENNLGKVNQEEVIKEILESID